MSLNRDDARLMFSGKVRAVSSTRKVTIEIDVSRHEPLLGQEVTVFAGAPPIDAESVTAVRLNAEICDLKEEVARLRRERRADYKLEDLLKAHGHGVEMGVEMERARA